MKFNKREEDRELQESLAEHLNRVQWHGHYFSACCPYHNEIHPSFFVYADGFRCASCGEFGSLSKLDKKLNGTEIVQIRQDNYEYAPFNTWKRKYKTWQKCASHAYHSGRDFPPLMSYLVKRGLRDAIPLGYMGYIDGWFSFPVFDPYGDMVDWVVRSHPAKEIELRYAIRPREGADDIHLYCPDWEAVENSDTVFLPFGLLDVWSVYLAGYPAITGLNGLMINPTLLDGIRKRIVIIPDATEVEMARKLAKGLGWRSKVLTIDYPDGTKDLNGVHQVYGLSAVKSLICY
jgi:hypothetical protein